MKIYAMTATFGKLEHETITFGPGLNVIEAPNEWGKSTWCAFLVTMLYGLDTRAKSTKTALSDKEHFAPWSGSPMSGRIDLNWEGRDITIERSTKGRTPMGEFRAYETATGLPVAEINAANCGTTLLGVEKSVFIRAGFLRLTDLPVTQDDALRRRLNALVTTGDESSAGDTLQKSLKELKNRCRYNRTGLLPQAEFERQQLQGQLDELETLDQEYEALVQKQKLAEQLLAQLKNHKQALRYESSLKDAAAVAQAESDLAQAQQIEAGCRAFCDGLPDAEEARRQIEIGRILQKERSALQVRQQMLPAEPEAPAKIPRYADGNALQIAKEDVDRATELTAEKGRQSPLPLIFVLLALVTFCVSPILSTPYRWIGIGVDAILLVSGVCIYVSQSRKRKAAAVQLAALMVNYDNLPMTQWLDDAAQYAAKENAYELQLISRQKISDALTASRKELEAKIIAFSPDQSLEQTIEHWQQALSAWDKLHEAEQETQQVQRYLDTVRSMANTAQPAPLPDTLTYSESQTDNLIASMQYELQQIHGLLGQNRGRAQNIGSSDGLRGQLKAVNNRISQLEDYYYALEIAQDALFRASTELQRRFAPKISKRAQELFSRITVGKYSRMTISDDLSLGAGAADEDTLRQAMWRSDGTMDGMYLALRLAVAEALTPNAPLILDDALLRLDNKRLAEVMNILKEMAQDKQIILFTCQGREKEAL